MKNLSKLQNVIGDRGELVFELAITDYTKFRRPLFKPAFLGDKWATVDYYVELTNIPKATPFFFVQVKSTAIPLLPKATKIKINIKKINPKNFLKCRHHIFGRYT